MADIKLRCWDMANKKFVDFETIKKSMYEIISNTRYFTTEQFAFFQDKNGAEVYAGDIVICNNGSWSETKVVKCEGVRGFYPFNEPLDYDPTDDDYLKSSEVELIGNIHENSDLIIPEKFLEPEPVDPVFHTIKNTATYKDSK